MKKKLLLLAALGAFPLLAGASVYTFEFDGEGDIAGVPRQLSNDVNTLEFVDAVSLEETGINFTLTNEVETGKGFALVNAGGLNAGWLVYSGMGAATYMAPKVTLTVPGGFISEIKFCMTGSSGNAGLASLDLAINGKETIPEKEDDYYYWKWSDKDGVETVSFEWDNRYYTRYIHSIELVYTADLGGKQECGLAFTKATAEAIMGEPFTAPSLKNPNKLPVNWTSSDETVATVDEVGKVTLVSGGRTVITVATEGNEEFAPGNARYTLDVIPTANSILEMKALAPEVYDRVKVACPLTVTFASTSFAYVIDEEGTAGYMENVRDKGSTSSSVKTIYKVGDIIPAGWIATNATIYKSVIWEGIPGDVTETTDVTYQEVESVTPEDVDKIVILKDVTFTTRTAFGNTKAWGTTPDGTIYEFQDTYGVSEYPAGTYDVTCAVRYSERGTTVYFYLSPISYAESSSVGVAGVDAENPGAEYYRLDGVRAAGDEKGIYVKVSGGKAEKIVKE